MNTATIDKTSDAWWAENRDEVLYARIGSMLGKMNSYLARSEIRQWVTTLSDRADNPADYIPEAVKDARHDLLVLAGMEGDQ